MMVLLNVAFLAFNSNPLWKTIESETFSVAFGFDLAFDLFFRNFPPK